MKILFLFFVCTLFVHQNGQSQLLKKLGDKVKQTADKTADKLLGNDKPAPTTNNDGTKTNTVSATENLALYAAYDFVPGDSVLFSDDLVGEEANEIPSKWILDRGRAEVNDIDGEMMIATRQGTILRPRMKTVSYLPKRFTIEYDVKYISWVWNYGRSIELTFANPSLDSNQNAGAFTNYLAIWASAEASFKDAKGEWPLPGRDDPAYQAAMKGWKHIAISVNEKSVKVYINQFRVLNAQLEYGTPSSLIFSISGDYDAPVLIKNFRIMAGGKTPAKQVTTNNVYIARGIQFEKGSAVLLPQSMGEINALVKWMKDDPSLKFEIAGHTSSEASSSAEANQKLSEERAHTVKAKMLEMGIQENRLTAKGYGQTKPIATNDTPEGRATNRRVAFVKQ
jgi:outer membrane protein OmpA-like peptidoglycan-associated protein